MSSMSAEATVVRNYLDWMVALPWTIRDKKIENIKIPEAKKILDEDHFGLEKVKERIDLDIGSTPSFLYSQMKTVLICLNPSATNADPLGDLTHTVSALDFGIRDLLICPLATTQLI